MENSADPKPAKFTKDDYLAGMPEGIQDAQIGPMVGISAIALNLALKYHDINTVQDGTLYQQYKLEGKNMRQLELAMVFDSAIQIEEHLIDANKRVALLLVAAAMDEVEDKPAGEVSESGPQISSDSA